MANGEHLAQLMNGVVSWYQWRKVNENVKPDLSGANLVGANLWGIDLNKANLNKANLNKAHLRRAHLNGAHLSGAKFSGANLSLAALSEANLMGANFSGANLMGANFSGANLVGANFSGANLSEADLSRANLSEADLSGANLTHAKLKGSAVDQETVIDEKWQLVWEIVNYGADGRDLSGTSLSGASLSGTSLSGANLSGTDLSNTDLRRANLIEANFREANLEGAFLGGAFLRGAFFGEASLRKANLVKADLSRAFLRGANLYGANLFRANLTAVQALAADLREAILTGACLMDWNINSETRMGNVACEFVYLKAQINQEVFLYLKYGKSFPGRSPAPAANLDHDSTEYFDYFDRCPSSGDFAPGEFAVLFQKALETVDLIFADGVDWKAFFQSFQELRSQYDNEELSIQAIEKKSGGAFVIRLEVPPEADKAAIESRAKDLYERERQLLEIQYREKLQAKDQDIERYKQENTNLWEVVKLQASRPINVEAKAVAENQSKNVEVEMTFQGQVFGAAGKVMGDQVINSPEQRQTLAEAAKEIQRLLNQLSEIYPTATSAEQMAIATKAVEEIERNPALKQRIVGALKAGGTEALKELVDHPAVNILLAVLEGWQKPE